MTDHGMTPTQAAALVALVRELCPAQQFGDNADEAWHLVLDDVPFDLAKQAVRTLIRQGNKFIDPGQVFGETRRIRRDHIERTGALPAPPADPALYRPQLQAMLNGIGRGMSLRDLDDDPEVRRAIAARQTPKAIGTSAQWDDDDRPTIVRRSGEVYDEIQALRRQPARPEAAQPAARPADPKLDRAARLVAEFGMSSAENADLVQQWMTQASDELGDVPHRDVVLHVAALIARHQDAPNGYD